MVIEMYKISPLLPLAEFSVDGLSGQRGSVHPASFLFLLLFDFSLDLSNRELHLLHATYGAGDAHRGKRPTHRLTACG